MITPKAPSCTYVSVHMICSMNIHGPLRATCVLIDLVIVEVDRTWNDKVSEKIQLEDNIVILGAEKIIGCALVLLGHINK